MVTLSYFPWAAPSWMYCEVCEDQTLHRQGSFPTDGYSFANFCLTCHTPSYGLGSCGNRHPLPPIKLGWK